MSGYPLGVTSATSPCQAAAEAVGSTSPPGERAGAGAASLSSGCGRRDEPPLVLRCGLCFSAVAHLLIHDFTRPRRDLDLAQGPLFHNCIRRKRLLLLFRGLTSLPHDQTPISGLISVGEVGTQKETPSCMICLLCLCAGAGRPCVRPVPPEGSPLRKQVCRATRFSDGLALRSFALPSRFLFPPAPDEHCDTTANPEPGP